MSVQQAVQQEVCQGLHAKGLVGDICVALSLDTQLYSQCLARKTTHPVRIQKALLHWY